VACLKVHIRSEVLVLPLTPPTKWCHHPMVPISTPLHCGPRRGSRPFLGVMWGRTNGGWIVKVAWITAAAFFLVVSSSLTGYTSVSDGEPQGRQGQTGQIRQGSLCGAVSFATHYRDQQDRPTWRYSQSDNPRRIVGRPSAMPALRVVNVISKTVGAGSVDWPNCVQEQRISENLREVH
jgi:hypothetical protein